MARRSTASRLAERTIARIVVVSDLHLDACTSGVERFDEVERAVQESVESALDWEADAWVCLGDVCDPDCGVVAFKAMALLIRVAQKLRGGAVDSVFIAGNHDVVERRAARTVLEPLSSVADYVVETPMRIQVGRRQYPIACLPYAPSWAKYDPAEYVKLWARAEGALKPRAVFGHLTLDGIVPGSETRDFPRGRESHWPLEALRRHLPDALLIGGHYHERQVFKGVQIVGSLARLTHGEEHCRPGYLRVEV